MAIGGEGEGGFGFDDFEGFGGFGIGSAESASIAASMPTAVAAVERSSSEESEDPCPDVFFRDWSGSYRDASGQRWQLASMVFDRGANMVHERWQREPPPIQPVNATDRQE